MATPSGSSSQTQLEKQRETENTIEKTDVQSAEADRNIQAFLKRSGQEASLSGKTTVQTKPTASSGLAGNQNTSQPEKTVKENTNGKPAKTIRINFEGGMFFDNETGILAYLKNVKLDETSSDFKLRCSEELKLLFHKKPTEGKKTDQSDDSQAEPTENKKDQSFAELGDLREIIATGNVRIAGTNSNGQPFLASGEEASYHAQNGEMILKGGRPTLQQTANQYLQAQEDGQWIKIQMKDKDIVSISTSKGKWETQAVIKQNPLSQ